MSEYVANEISLFFFTVQIELHRSARSLLFVISFNPNPLTLSAKVVV